MIGFDDFFKISDETTSVIEYNRYLVITNVFCFGHVQHDLNQYSSFALREHFARLGYKYITKSFLHYTMEFFRRR